MNIQYVLTKFYLRYLTGRLNENLPWKSVSYYNVYIFARQGFSVLSVPHKCGAEWTGNPYTWLAKMVSKGSCYKKIENLLQGCGGIVLNYRQISMLTNSSNAVSIIMKHFFKSGSRKNLRICFQLDMHISIRLLSKKNNFTQFPFSINQILEEKPHCFSSSECVFCLTLYIDNA